jgi:hypothetical protein
MAGPVTLDYTDQETGSDAQEKLSVDSMRITADDYIFRQTDGTTKVVPRSQVRAIDIDEDVELQFD